jgi:5-methylcytosine-specific restriction endonuclease McrA
MVAYCVGELRLSEAAAFKRINAARVARQFPAIFEALADGRLHVSGVLMLAPKLTEDNANELLAAAANRSKSELELLLAQRFPRPDVPTRLQAVTPEHLLQLAPERVDELRQLAPERVGEQQEHAPAPALRAKVTPLAPERYALQLTIDQSTHDKLRRAQELLSHQIRPGDVATVLDRALDALITKLEKRKFAATEKPRSTRRPVTNKRCIPAHVRRAVWKRDGGQCTFVSAEGKRCSARTMLEFDHWKERSRGGAATVENIRLRCRGHNQYAAERTYGREFMREKREEASEAREKRRAEASALAKAAVGAQATAAQQAAVAAAIERAVAAKNAEAQDVIPWLRQLGLRDREARRAAALCEGIPDAPLEQRVRVALSYLRI